MVFKALLLFFLPFSLFALPGYYTPWGKDQELCSPSKSSIPQKQDSLAATLAKKAIVFHQKVLSPVDGPRSHFYPCSSQYMKLAITKHGFAKGFLMGCDRLLRENKDPWAYRNVLINGQLIKYDPPR